MNSAHREGRRHRQRIPGEITIGQHNDGRAALYGLHAGFGQTFDTRLQQRPKLMNWLVGKLANNPSGKKWLANAIEGEPMGTSWINPLFYLRGIFGK